MRIAQIEDLLDEFDFDKVKKVMDFLDWKYFDIEDGEGMSVGRLRQMARYLLELVYNEEDQEHSFTASGGFHAERWMYPGDTQKYLELKFVITEWSNPVC